MACKCKCKGATSSKGDKGNPGKNGIDGLYGGWSSAWLFDNGVTSTPGAGDLRLNASDPTAATAIYVNKTNANSIIILAFLASFTNSGAYGWVRLFTEKDSTIFSYYKVTNVTLTGNVYTLAVTYVDGSGVTPFVNNVSLVLSFTPRGLDGARGTTSIDYSYSVGSDTPFISATTATSYREAATILFKGSTHFGASPTSIKVISKLQDAFSVNYGTIQIYDVTNSVVIGTTGNINTNVKTIWDVPIVGAIPAGEAIWEIRMKQSGTGDQNILSLYSLNIDF